MPQRLLVQFAWLFRVPSGESSGDVYRGVGSGAKIASRSSGFEQNFCSVDGAHSRADEDRQ